MSLNEELQKDALAFATKYCILGDNEARVPATDVGPVNGYIHSKMPGLAKISWLNCEKAALAAELHSQAFGNPDNELMVNEGAETVVVTAHGWAPGLVPAWFLPWDPRGGAVSMSIPSMGKFELGHWQANRTFGGSAIGGGKVVDEYPRLFLTAAINGCSVFVMGEATSPKVFHGGKGSDVEGDAIQVWRDMVLKIAGKPDGDPNMGEANKSMYVKDGVSKDAEGYNTTATANDFQKTLNETYKHTSIKIKAVRPWGAVFGVCDDGGQWKFYLQENATIRFDVVKKIALGPMTKKPKPYSVSRPMTVRQIFPKLGGAAIMKNNFSWEALV